MHCQWSAVELEVECQTIRGIVQFVSNDAIFFDESLVRNIPNMLRSLVLLQITALWRVWCLWSGCLSSCRSLPVEAPYQKQPSMSRRPPIHSLCKIGRATFPPPATPFKYIGVVLASEIAHEAILNARGYRYSNVVFSVNGEAVHSRAVFNRRSHRLTSSK